MNFGLRERHNASIRIETPSKHYPGTSPPKRHPTQHQGVKPVAPIANVLGEREIRSNHKSPFQSANGTTRHSKAMLAGINSATAAVGEFRIPSGDIYTPGQGICLSGQTAGAGVILPVYRTSGGLCQPETRLPQGVARLFSFRWRRHR